VIKWLVRQSSVIVAATHVVLIQRVNILVRQNAIIVHMKCQRLTVISVSQLNLHSGAHGESFTCATLVVSRYGENEIATTMEHCLGECMPIEPH